jgi:putative transposase
MMNADVNGAVDIRRNITRTPPTGDVSSGCLAQPGVYLFDTTTGAFHPQEQADCKP